MKVLFITREGYELSGARVHGYHFARELVRQGIEARVLSFTDDRDTPCMENMVIEKIGYAK